MKIQISNFSWKIKKTTWQQQTHIAKFLLGSNSGANKQLSLDNISVLNLATVST